MSSVDRSLSAKQKTRGENDNPRGWGEAEENELIILPADFRRLSLHEKLEKR
nr:MAG TPA: hypothetical protein [Caudoviricetes sp.]